MTSAPGGLGWIGRPVRIELPFTVGSSARPMDVAVPVRAISRLASVLLVAVPVALAVVGVVVAVLGASAAQRDTTEAAGSFALEAGAAMWFAGVVTLGARSGATVLRLLLLALTALAGVVLVVLATVRDWSGAALDLAMEFGVGLLAVAVLDVVLLGVLHRQVEQLARHGDRVVTVRFGRSWRLVEVDAAGEPDQSRRSSTSRTR